MTTLIIVFLIAIIILLVILLVGLEVLHCIERKDLYNRIMSKDLKEYQNIDEKPHRRISKHERMLAKWRGVEVEE
ncbi:MAG: hypothetical protein ACI4EA_08165 [Candidatus Ornithomonoglobus sp.]